MQFVDWSTHLYLLTESFQKYNVEDEDCQILVACLAGKEAFAESEKNESNSESNSKLAKLTSSVHKILR